MTDWKDFDDALQDAVADLPPPEDTVQTVTPFRAAIRSVTAGLCLSFFTLDAWYLQYLLPALGAVLLCLGTRSLRNNSRWFCFMWIISVCEALSLYCNTMLQATRLPDLTAFPWLSLGLRAALLVCLHLGLRQAAAETGHSPKGAPVLWALVWYGVLVLLGIFWPQPGWIVFLTMAAAFVCIVRSLLRVSAQLSEAGYSLRAAPVRVSGGKLAAAYLLSLAALTAGLSLAANHLPVEGHPVEQLSGSSETAAIRTDLKALGFPEDLLDLLPETEIAKLSGAEGVQVNLEAAWADSTDNGVRYTDLFVLTSPRSVRCYHFFTVDTPVAVLQNQVRMEASSFHQISNPAGQILWNRGGTLYAASLSLEEETYTNPLFSQTYSSFTALFSYPFAGKDRQGWCAYTASFAPDEWPGSVSILRYQTQALRNLFPYAPLPEQPQVGMLNDLESQSYSTYDFGPTWIGN